MQRGEQEDLAPLGLPNPAGTHIQDPFPEWGPVWAAEGALRALRQGPDVQRGWAALESEEQGSQTPPCAAGTNQSSRQNIKHSVLSPNHHGGSRWGSSPALGTVSDTCTPWAPVVSLVLCSGLPCFLPSVSNLCPSEHTQRGYRQHPGSFSQRTVIEVTRVPSGLERVMARAWPSRAPSLCHGGRRLLGPAQTCSGARGPSV